MSSKVKAKNAAKAGSRSVAVDAVFKSHPKAVRGRLNALRRLIFRTARTTEGVGALVETLKWGQPSYLTTASGSGSMIRIDRVKSEPGKYAICFYCQTNLVATFRDIYPNELSYRGNRCILLDVNEKADENALRHCISLALTYHMRKSPSRTGAASPEFRRKPS